jgi:molybdopterin-containing oxidoreductase family membrane subunit
MWFERFVIIVTSLHRDYLPSSWVMFSPTIIDVTDYLLTFGIFFTLFFLFAKFLPVINMAEVKAVLKGSSEKLAAQKPRTSATQPADFQTRPAFNKDVE